MEGKPTESESKKEERISIEKKQNLNEE